MLRVVSVQMLGIPWVRQWFVVYYLQIPPDDKLLVGNI